MEQQISPYIQSILSTVQNYDKKICSESTNYETTLKEKDTTINALKELNSKLKSEMDDFLKVSFAARWKNKSEQLEKQNIYLEDKISRLTTTNEKLNKYLQMENYEGGELRKHIKQFPWADKVPGATGK